MHGAWCLFCGSRWRLAGIIGIMAMCSVTVNAAGQTVRLQPGEQYVLVANGTERVTDGKGGARLVLEDRSIQIDPAGQVVVQDRHGRIISHGEFRRWQGLGSGSINIEGGRSRATQIRLEYGSQLLIFR